MNTETGSGTIEGLLGISLCILLAAMIVETRCLFRSGEEVQLFTRNAAISRASTDEGALRLMGFETTTQINPFRVLKPLLETAGLQSLKIRYYIFVGTESHGPGRQG